MIVEEFGSGDLVCGRCGLVLGDRIVDTRSEWRVSETEIFFGFLLFFPSLLGACALEKKDAETKMI